MKLLPIFIFFWAIVPRFSAAQTCCSGGVPVSSNLGFQSTEAHITQLSFSGDFNFLKTLKSGSETLDDDQRLRTTQSYIFRGAHALSDRFTIEVFLPFVRQTRRITSLTGNTDRESTFGIGDPVVLALYKVLDKNVTIRIGGGPQIPLGDFQQTNDRGLTLVEDLQPGSGAWDLITMASLEFVPSARPSSLLFLNAIWSKTGSNPNARGGTQTYQFGNDIQVIGGYSDQVLLDSWILTPGALIRYRWADRDQVNQNDLPGTGGSFLFGALSLGIPFIQLSSNLNLNFEWPLWSNVNDTQLAPSYRMNIGWSYTIEPSSNVISINDQ